MTPSPPTCSVSMRVCAAKENAAHSKPRARHDLSEYGAIPSELNTKRAQLGEGSLAYPTPLDGDRLPACPAADGAARLLHDGGGAAVVKQRPRSRGSGC